MLAAKGYAANSVRALIGDFGSRPAVPTTSNEAPVDRPAWIHNNRHLAGNSLVENTWVKLKEWQAVAIRDEKATTSYPEVLCPSMAVQWITS